MVKQYELMVLLPSEYTADQMKTFVGQITKLVEGKKGKIVSHESLGKRQLAYLISKQSEAFYVLFIIEMDTAVAQAFERDVRLMDDVMRELFVIHEEIADAQTVKTDTIEEKE